ncbi:MAG TPA: ankyrin repeat domain-containing protein [Vicinamibacterales bacterium]
MNETVDPISAFIEAACVPLEGSHRSGTLDSAELIRHANADALARDIYASSILGDDQAVRQLVAADKAAATAAGGPRQWDALTCLCFSRYLRLDQARSDGFLTTATILLDAGASANSGWFETHHQPAPAWESVIYGAAGVAQHPGLTRLLLERGADPNDDETPYHVPETHDNATLRVLVESGKLTAASMATMLLRKTDWHDYDGIKWLLERGVDPNLVTHWAKTALHNAVLSDNHLAIVELLLAHGADPTLTTTRPDRSSRESSRESAGASAFAIAARRGRGDVLAAFEKAGFSQTLEGVDGLLAACAQADGATVRLISGRAPETVAALRVNGGRYLAAFSGVGNVEGVRQLLDLGVSVSARYEEGEAYFDIAPQSLAIHVAAWRAQHAVVRLLIEQGSPVDQTDMKGRTPLALAVRACVDSFWMARRSPESVQALLSAGASAASVPFPSGYSEVDALLKAASS